MTGNLEGVASTVVLRMQQVVSSEHDLSLWLDRTCHRALMSLADPCSQFQTTGPLCINKTTPLDRMGLKCGEHGNHKCTEWCHYLRATLMFHLCIAAGLEVCCVGGCGA